jgi:S-DNA-T family DNA segregation ATPase FtsK/SpoIIIE
MAKRSKQTQKSNRARDDRYKFLAGIFILFFAIYLTIAFTSFFFTWKSDQSFEWGHVVSNANITVENWAGKVGARFANLFIAKWFGVTSFAIPFLLIIIGFKLLHIRLLPVKKTIQYTIIGTIITSLLLGYLFQDLDGYLVNGLGGAHGLFMASWLNAFIGKTGTAFLIALLIIGFTISIIPRSIYELKADVKKFFQEFSFRKPFPNIKPQTAHSQEVTGEADHAPYNPTQPQRDTSSYNQEQDYARSEMELTNELEPQAPNDSEEKTVKQDMKVEKTTGNDQPTSQHDTKAEESDEEGDIKLTIEQTHQENYESFDDERRLEDYDPTLELSHFQMPPIEILEEYEENEGETRINKEEIIRNKNKIVETLGNYKIQIDKIKATVGPTITLYEIVPAPGIRISKIKNLEDDIALSLAALGIRIIAPIPGKGTIGIEVPNENREIVSMRTILASKNYIDSKYDLPIGLGKTISNDTYIVDLAKMPHMLVAGATGQGKSVGLNAIITSLLYKKHPAQLKFVMVDPKKVELTLYSKIKNHYLAKMPDIEEPIVTENQDVIKTLNSLCVEMDDRYNLLKKAHVRNIKEYNRKFIKKRLNPDKGHRYLPYIVVVIDEFADLIMTAGKEVESPIARLAQLARAIGIHLIIATQRPTTNIITGVIKANFPARIAFRVTAMVDSRTILDSTGANQLIGQGDMLISTGSDLTRLQCAFIDTDELEKLTDFISNQQGFPQPYTLPEYEDESTGDGLSSSSIDKWDSLFEEAARMVVRNQQGSTSLIQRKLAIGYNRAGRIMDQLEAANIVGPHEGSKARQVLFPDEYALEQYLKDLNK